MSIYIKSRTISPMFPLWPSRSGFAQGCMVIQHEITAGTRMTWDERGFFLYYTIFHIFYTMDSTKSHPLSNLLDMLEKDQPNVTVIELKIQVNSHSLKTLHFFGPIHQHIMPPIFKAKQKLEPITSSFLGCIHWLVNMGLLAKRGRQKCAQKSALLSQNVKSLSQFLSQSYFSHVLCVFFISDCYSWILNVL